MRAFRTERPLRLEADEQDRRGTAPQPFLQMMPYASRIAHAACCDHDMKAAEAVDGLALLDGFREPDLAILQGLEQGVTVGHVARVFLEDPARLGRKR